MCYHQSRAALPNKRGTNHKRHKKDFFFVLFMVPFCAFSGLSRFLGQSVLIASVGLFDLIRGVTVSCHCTAALTSPSVTRSLDGFPHMDFLTNLSSQRLTNRHQILQPRSAGAFPEAVVGTTRFYIKK